MGFHINVSQIFTPIMVIALKHVLHTHIKIKIIIIALTYRINKLLYLIRIGKLIEIKI